MPIVDTSMIPPPFEAPPPPPRYRMMSQAAALNLSDSLREAVCAWLVENDINPAEIPGDATITLTRDGITYPRRIKGPMWPALEETVTAMMVVEPNDAVRNWLMPRCPTCGR